MSKAADQVETKHPSRAPSRTLRNVLSNWTGYFFSIVITFFLSPFIVHHLGNSAYGVWVLLVSLTGYLGLLDLGVRGAVTRYVAKFHAQASHEEASRVASSSLGIFTAAGVVAISVSLGLTVFALGRLHIPENYRAAAFLILPLAGMTVAVSLVGGVFGGILAGLQRFDLVNAIEISSSALRALVIVLVLRGGGGIVALACIQLAFSIASGLTYYWASLRLYPQLRISTGYIDRQHLSLIFSFSVYSFLLQVFAYLILYTDAIVIAAFLPITMVTYFSIAGNLITYARALVGGISQTMSPLASNLEVSGKHAEIQRITQQSSGYATALMLPIVLTFMLRGSTFIGLWMGAEYAKPSGEVLWVLALSGVFSAGIAVAWSVILGVSLHKRLVPVYLAESLANLVLSIILVRKIGIVGVAWGTTLPNMATCLFFWPWYLRRTLKIPIRSYVLSTWVRPIAAMIPFALCTYSMDRWWRAPNLLLFFLEVALALPLALLGFWIVCVPQEERQTYLQRLKQFTGV